MQNKNDIANEGVGAIGERQFVDLPDFEPTFEQRVSMLLCSVRNDAQWLREGKYPVEALAESLLTACKQLEPHIPPASGQTEAGIPSEPVAWKVVDASGVEPLCTVYHREDAERWEDKGHRVEPLYAAPIPSVPPGYKPVPVEPTSSMLFCLMRDPNTCTAAQMRERYGEMLAAAPAVPEEIFSIVEGIELDAVAKAIHYPECWDTAAYPTLGSALVEVYGSFKCTNQDTHLAAEAGGTDNRVGAGQLSSDFYLLMAYGEGDDPEFRIAHTKEQAVLAMISMMLDPEDDPDEEEREYWTRHFDDPDNWALKRHTLDIKFEIGGISVIKVSLANPDVMAASAVPSGDGALLEAAVRFARAHITCDEIEETDEWDGHDEACEAYNRTKKALIAAFKALEVNPLLTSIAPEPTHEAENSAAKGVNIDVPAADQAAIPTAGVPRPEPR